MVWKLTSRARGNYSVGSNIGVVIYFIAFSLNIFFSVLFSFSTYFCPLVCFPVFSLRTIYSLARFLRQRITYNHGSQQRKPVVWQLYNQRITMINNNNMTMRLTMVNLAVAKGSRNQCTTSLTLWSGLRQKQNTLKKVKAQNILYYSRHSEVRPLTCNYEAVLFIGKFPHWFSLRFSVYPSLLQSWITQPI